MELICHISSHLPTEDLGNLRLTCKNVEAMLFDLFAAEFFATRQFFLHPISLCNLIEISKHPQFSKQVKKVIFCDERIKQGYPPTQFEEEQQQLQMHFIQSGECWQILKRALSKLPNCRTVEQRDWISIRRRLRDDTEWRSYGVQSLIKSNSRANPSFIQPYITNEPPKASAFLFSLAETFKEKGKLESIQCINNRMGWFCSDLYIPARLEDTYRNAFSTVKTLMLFMHEIQNDKHRNCFRRFLDIFAALDHLRVNVYTAGFDGISPCDDVLQMISEKPIRKLELGKFTISASGLESLFKAQKDHIESITFFRMILYVGVPMIRRSDDSPWKEVLNLCTIPTNLKSITIDNVSDTNWGSAYITNEQIVYPPCRKWTIEESDASKMPAKITEYVERLRNEPRDHDTDWSEIGDSVVYDSDGDMIDIDGNIISSDREIIGHEDGSSDDGDSRFDSDGNIVKSQGNRFDSDGNIMEMSSDEEPDQLHATRDGSEEL
jgi:F-box domain